MKIELEYTPEELTQTINGLNNAIIALRDIYNAARWGCELPEKWERFFKDKPFKEIDAIVDIRSKALKDLYDKLLSYEQ